MATPIETPNYAGLSSTDAEFLDGMLALQQQTADLCQKYLADSDHTSNTQVVDMARNCLDQLSYANEAFRQARGYADGDDLRRQEIESEVEVEGSY